MSRWRVARAGGLVLDREGRALLPLTLTGPGGAREHTVLVLDRGGAELLHAQLSRLLAPPVHVPPPSPAELEADGR